MVTLTNLRLPISFATALPQDNNFDISRDQLDDFLEAIGDIDWGLTNFLNVGNINGTPVSGFWTDTVNGVLGDLQDVNANASLGNQQGDILYYDGVSWNRFPRGLDGQFLKSSVSGIAWGSGTAQINDFADNAFTVFLNTDANKAFRFSASLITTTIPTVRTVTIPDKNGTMAMLDDIIASVNEFDDSLFRVFDDLDNTKKLAFQIAGITTGITRTATWPDKSGVVAFLDDITAPGNTFADDLFRIFDNVDNTKLLAFELTPIANSTTRTITMIDENLTIVGLTNIQTLMNKTLDASNVVVDGALSSNVVLESIANTFAVGFRQTFQADLVGSSGLRLSPIAGNPTSFLDGDMWVNSTLGKAFIRIGGVSVDFSSAQAVDTSFVITCSDEGTDLDTLNNPKTTFRMPYGYVISAVRATVRVAPVGSTIIVDIKQNNVSILSTLITIDAGEFSSFTAAIPPVILTSSLTNDAEIEIFLNQVGSTTAGKGLKVYLIGQHV